VKNNSAVSCQVDNNSAVTGQVENNSAVSCQVENNSAVSCQVSCHLELTLFLVVKRKTIPLSVLQEFLFFSVLTQPGNNSNVYYQQPSIIPGGKFIAASLSSGY
jgi:hypothetical protein